MNPYHPAKLAIPCLSYQRVWEHAVHGIKFP